MSSTPDLFGREKAGGLRWRGARIDLGTSGYSFPDWKGSFYPADIPQSGMLEYYAGRFGAVEINSTYYRILPERTTRGMADRTPDGFTFSVKLHSSMTHDSTAGDAEWGAFTDMLRPLRESGKLGAVLAQFPWSLRPDGEGMRRLDLVRERCGGFPLAVEFRHDSWYGDDVLPGLMSSGLNPVTVDLPGMDHLPDRRPLAGRDFAYVRFHGRNGEQWWDGGPLRYDYLYSPGELKSWLPAIEKLAEATGRVFMFWNNCHMGKAALNADFMKSLLEGEG